MNAKQYRREQDKALAALIRKIRQLFVAYGVPVTDAQREAMALLLLRSVRNARERNYTVTQAYIASQLIGVDIPDLQGYPINAVISGLERATKDLIVLGEPVTERNRQSTPVMQAGTKAVTGDLQRQAQEPARETVKDLAESVDGLGWARMLTGPTSCSFCAMLASRGPVYKSRESAVGRGGNPLNLYHTAHLDNGKLVGGDCDCVAVLVVDYQTWEGRESFEKLEKLWENTGQKASNQAARNKFRTAWEAKIRSGESGEYLAETMK